MTDTTWQSIETSPKDETWVLLWFEDEATPPEPIVRSGFWSEEYHDWYESEAASNSLSERYGAPKYWAVLSYPVDEQARDT